MTDNELRSQLRKLYHFRDVRCNEIQDEQLDESIKRILRRDIDYWQKKIDKVTQLIREKEEQ